MSNMSFSIRGRKQKSQTEFIRGVAFIMASWLSFVSWPQVSTFLNLALSYNKAPQQEASKTIQIICSSYHIPAHELWEIILILWALKIKLISLMWVQSIDIKSHLFHELNSEERRFVSYSECMNDIDIHDASFYHFCLRLCLCWVSGSFERLPMFYCSMMFNIFKISGCCFYKHSFQILS